MVECGICLEEYQEGDLELHRQMCVVRLMFRCSLCGGDYVNKEGLWNHLDLHEIADESKELHYQEIKAKHKLHQCVLCNDQRAYSESPYWKHIHDVHDGFFLKCSDCGENFRSEKLKNDHASSRCKARDPIEEEHVPFEVGNMTANAEPMKLSCGDQSSNTNDNRLSIDYADKNIIDKESELPTINLPSQFPCDICGKSFSSKLSLLRHEAAKCKSMQRKQHNSSRSSSDTKCLHCNKEFISASSLRQHISNRHQPTECSICGITFEGYYQARYHKIQVHSETQKHTKPRYECVKCSKKFICIALYKHHSNVCDSVQNDSSSHKSSGELILKYKRYQKVAVEKNHKINRYKELKYQCPNCWRKFHDKKKYDTHCYFCEQKEYSCKLCGHMFKEFYSVKRHNRRYHPEQTSFKNIQKHKDKKQMRNHKPRKANFQCPHCSRIFRLKNTFEDHAASCANLKHACEICGQRFNLRNRVEDHKKRIHLASGPLRNSHIEATDSEEEHNQNSVEKIGAAQETTICSNVAAENPLNEASCTNCSHCGIEESSAVALTRHILNHHDPVACDFCGVTFSSLSQAQHHVKTKHKDSQLKCAHCSRRFSLRVRFEKHVPKCEKEIIPCEFCGTMFENATAVTEHKRLTCRAYNRIKEQEQKNAMTSLGTNTDSSTAGDQISPLHVESNLSKTKCLYCDEEFPSPEYLTVHLKTYHELTKCDICGITIIGLSSNKNHKIKCHQEPKYECRTCGRKFHCKRAYNKHCFACEHKLYSCKSCGHTFKQLYSIQKHTKRCHPDENISENIEIIQGQNQVQNIDLKMEITVEEATISARDDQGLSSVNLSSKGDASNSRSNEHSSAYLNEDEIMDNRVIDKESQMVFVAPLNDIEQVVEVEISQPLEENLPNQPYSCNICGITMHRYSRLKYHRAIKHKEGQHQCPHCSRKFHYKIRLEEHVSRCARLKYSCELCGQKFNFQRKVEDHKKRVHHGSKPSRDANIEGADCTEGKKQDSVEKIDAAEDKTSCIVCKISFASTDELMKHKLNCPKYTKEHDDSQFTTEDISLFHGVSEAQADSTIVTQGEIIKLKHEIEEDETLLQEQEFEVPNENPERSSASSVIIQGQKQVQNIDLKMEITVEETTISARDDQGLSSTDPSSKADASNSRLNENSSANLNDDEIMDSQVTEKESPMITVAPLNDIEQVVKMESSQLLEKNLPNQPYSCNICGITMHKYSQFSYHRTTKHKEGKLQCPNCSRKFHFKKKLEEHVSCCARLKHSCELCGQKFNLQSAVEDHKKRVHHGSSPSRDANIAGADCTEEKKQNSEEKIDATGEMTSCIVCRISFTSTDELTKHKPTCPKRDKKHDESTFGAEDTSLLHVVKEAQTNSTIGEHIELKLEIDVEETMLQEQEYSVSNENPERSTATAMKTKHKDSQLKCAHCSRRFSLRVRFEKHVPKCEKEIIPCEFCGTMFENATAVTEHKRLTCRAYNRIKEQEQKNAMTSLGTNTDSSTAGDQISPLHVESNLSKTKCLYCDEEFPSPEYLTVHLKTYHELTKCDICGITIIGLSSNKNHKIKCHQEPKYECRTCGRKFHCKRAYNKHCFACEHKLYSCKSCGHTFKQLYSIQKHTKRCHPDENISENIEIIQGQNQVQNIDLKMEITVEEATISARDDQGLSSVNLSSKGDASNSRSNEHSSAYLNEDEIMDNRVIDKESQMVFVAPLNDIEQVVEVEISQPLEENLPNQPYSCNICGITMHRYSRLKYHRAIKHKEGQHQCPHCSRKFHYKIRLEEHVSRCARLKYSCELCGQKFNFQRKVEDHKKRVHHGSKPSRDANIEGADCTEGKKQDSVEKIDAAEDKTSCIVCKISFASTDELMKHKLNCPKYTKEHDDSQFTTEDISLFHGVSEAQADSTIVTQGEIIKLKHEIEEDETLLQEQEFEVPNENPERSSASSVIIQGQKQVQNIDLKMEITVEETTISARDDQGLSSTDPSSKADASNSRLNENSSANLNDDEIMDSQVTEKESPMITVAPLNDIEQVVKMESSQLLEKNLPNQPYSCNICGITMHKYSQFSYHRTTKHKEGKLQCPNCSRKFHFKKKLEEHVSCCARLKHSCELCGQKFNLQSAVEDHKKRVHHGSSPSRDANIAGADCTEEKKQNSEEKIDATGEMTSCIVCRISFTSTDELTKHKPTCPKRDKKHDESTFGAEDTSLLHVVKEAQTNSTIGEHIELKLEIDVEETMLQEQEYSVSNENPERSTATAMTNQMDFGYDPVKTCSFDDAKSFVKNFEFGFACLMANGRGERSTRYYRCTRVKQRARPQCERKVLIFTPNINEKSTVYATGEHSCVNAPPENLTVPEIDLGYVPVKTCSFDDAISFIKNFEFGYGFIAKKDRDKCDLRYYRCKRVKHRAKPQCQRRVLIFTPNINEKSTVCTKGEHSCIHAPPENLTAAKLSVEQKDIIRKLLENKVGKVP